MPGDVLISYKLSATPPEEFLGDPKYEELSVSLFLQEENEWVSCEVTLESVLFGLVNHI